MKKEQLKRAGISLKPVLAVSAALVPASMMAAEPNVIIILADDLGIGDISAFNPGSKIRTENIDRLCRNGIRFTDAHSTSAVSTPSRYSLMTGRYAFRTTLKTGTLVGFSDPLIDRGRTTMADMFRAKGYDTACMGKWHLGWYWGKNADGEVDYSLPIQDGPTTRGFDYFYGISASLDMSPYVYVENDMPTALPDRTFDGAGGLLLQRKGPMGADFETMDVLPSLGRRSVEYIEGHKGSDKPFFLYLPLTAPHTPILPTPEYQGKSGLSPYGDFVLMIDDIIGDIVKTLKKTGQYDNTIIVFTSDNGCAHYADMKGMQKDGHFPSYIYRGSKSDLYEGGHRVPLVLSWGGNYKKQTEEGLVCLSDLFATFADMTGYGISDNEGEDSWSFWPLLDGSGSTSRPDIVHHSIDGYFSLRSGKWKLLFCPGSGGWSYPTMKDVEKGDFPDVQLYDMETDPSEKENVYAQHPYIVKELTERMRRYLEEGRSTPGIHQQNAAIKRSWKQTDAFMK